MRVFTASRRIQAALCESPGALCEAGEPAGAGERRLARSLPEPGRAGRVVAGPATLRRCARRRPLEAERSGCRTPCYRAPCEPAQRGTVLAAPRMSPRSLNPHSLGSLERPYEGRRGRQGKRIPWLKGNGAPRGCSAARWEEDSASPVAAGEQLSAHCGGRQTRPPDLAGREAAGQHPVKPSP